MDLLTNLFYSYTPQEKTYIDFKKPEAYKNINTSQTK